MHGCCCDVDIFGSTDDKNLLVVFEEKEELIEVLLVVEARALLTLQRPYRFVIADTVWYIIVVVRRPQNTKEGFVFGVRCSWFVFCFPSLFVVVLVCLFSDVPLSV